MSLCEVFSTSILRLYWTSGTSPNETDLFGIIWYVSRTSPGRRRPFVTKQERFMSRHENLKSDEACKEETYINDYCFSQLASFSQNLNSFFLNGSCNEVFKACCFKNFLLKNFRHFFC